jgi:hypothetical protein
VSSAIDIQDHLRELHAERALALITGLGADDAYMADLDDEISATRSAYMCTAVTEIAWLRAELSGPQVG